MSAFCICHAVPHGAVLGIEVALYCLRVFHGQHEGMFMHNAILVDGSGIGAALGVVIPLPFVAVAYLGVHCVVDNLLDKRQHQGHHAVAAIHGGKGTRVGAALGKHFIVPDVAAYGRYAGLGVRTMVDCQVECGDTELVWLVGVGTAHGVGRAVPGVAVADGRPCGVAHNYRFGVAAVHDEEYTVVSQVVAIVHDVHRVAIGIGDKEAGLISVASLGP